MAVARSEHDVSIISATSILGALDRSRYDVSLIGVDAEASGIFATRRIGWPKATGASPAYLGEERVFLPANARDEGVARLRALAETPTVAGDTQSGSDATRIDVIFPIIHGKGGEDGSLQGLLESANVPYVGSGVLSTAIQMDKDFAKRILAYAGLPVTPWITFSGGELARDGIPAAAMRAEAEIGFPAFVKPANSGSSIGITRVENRAEAEAAIAGRPAL